MCIRDRPCRPSSHARAPSRTPRYPCKHRVTALSGGQDLRPLWFCPKGLQKDALLFKNALLGPAVISPIPNRPNAPRRTAMTAQTALPSQPLRVATLSSRKPTRFAFRPQAADRALIAAALGLLDLPALELVGEIRPEGRRDLRLEARLTAQAVPVSYTHLDVYKRQVPDHRTAPNSCDPSPPPSRSLGAGSRTVTCLLYTSRCV